MVHVSYLLIRAQVGKHFSPHAEGIRDSQDRVRRQAESCLATNSRLSMPDSPSGVRGGPSAPVVVSTWRHGLPANAAAWTALDDGATALDAVEAGVAVPEADPEVRTVGRGGYPDRSGTVTVDACVMDERGRCGAVAALPRIQHPTAVARAVMEETPHVMLAGEGALAFAREHGFDETDLLTEQSKQDWQEWREKQSDAARPAPNIEDETGNETHDTIGLLALDAQGHLAGACTTSGTPWKMPGRVGDSPLIGAGLYVDDEVGAACATGWGEAVMRVAGSHLAVETMRQGASPTAACRRVIERVEAMHTDLSDVQVGVLALSTTGEIGAYSLQSGFDTARCAEGNNQLIEADCLHS